MLRGSSFYVRRSVRSVVLFVLAVQEEEETKVECNCFTINLFYIRQHTLQTAAAEKGGNNRSVVTTEGP